MAKKELSGAIEQYKAVLTQLVAVRGDFISPDDRDMRRIVDLSDALINTGEGILDLAGAPATFDALVKRREKLGLINTELLTTITAAIQNELEVAQAAQGEVESTLENAVLAALGFGGLSRPIPGRRAVPPNVCFWLKADLSEDPQGGLL